MNKNNWRRLPVNPCACGCGHLVAKKYKKGHGRRRPLSERLMSRVTRTDSCWIWQGAVGSDGYGRIGVGGNATTTVHRAAYEVLIGPVPPGLHIDHLCRNRLCMKPEHLEAVTQIENNRRMRLSPEDHFSLSLTTGERHE